MHAAEFVALIPRLRRYARALVGDRASADDLVQDTLERAWARFHLWQRGTDLRAWLFTVMHNVNANRARALRVHSEFDEDAPEAQFRPAENGLLELRDLERALADLPVEQREVLLLVALEDMSYTEAAATLGIPIGTVMSRLSRGRERLRVLMHGPQAAVRLKRVK
ncbi:MAG: sigma-70 family RNA polymerase sigma factor [Betaproteobacteria bacterium]|nr:sigma-70 family RNA polymerase sigma factor [Betaproteobacteria bacterium]